MAVHLTIAPEGDPNDYDEHNNILARDWSEAKHIMMLGVVNWLTLPYWLGTCEACKAKALAENATVDLVNKVIEDKPKRPRKKPAAGCEHAGTGLDFLKWLDATGFWMVGDGANSGIYYVSNGTGDEVASIYVYVGERAVRLGIAA